MPRPGDFSRQIAAPLFYPCSIGVHLRSSAAKYAFLPADGNLKPDIGRR
jgi:hypothetical protein